jgi:hypothetical protein
VLINDKEDRKGLLCDFNQGKSGGILSMAFFGIGFKKRAYSLFY